MLSRLFCVAPMMAWTDRHCRYFLRQISRRCLLYTEMVTTGAILHGKDPERFLQFNPEEQPLAIQLGGDQPLALARCARIAEDWGYAEVNLNVGCPSERVQTGRFGACLMAHPEQVAEMVAAMSATTRLPITVKHRVGVDDLDRYEDMARFVGIVAEAGCKTFIVHARKAWLQGLSPAQNRSVPPLRFDDVFQLKRDFPHLEIILNGGLLSVAHSLAQLPHVDGVMLGRALYHDPWMLAQVDRQIYAASSQTVTRRQVVQTMRNYAAQEIAAGRCNLHQITRHMLGLFHNQAGSRAWKRIISERAHNADATLLAEAMAAVPNAVLDQRAPENDEK